MSPTIDLRELKCTVMARSLEEQRTTTLYDGLALEERLGLLVDQELCERKNRRLRRLLQLAKLRCDAVIENVDFSAHRGLDRSLVLSLAESHWVTSHHDVAVTGPTGVGKTYVACALANAAIRHGHPALCVRRRACSRIWRSPAPVDGSRSSWPLSAASRSSSSTTCSSGRVTPSRRRTCSR